MKLKLGILFVAICVYSMSFAQLSTRENTTSVFKTGSRPEAGSYGVYIGPSLREIVEMSESDEFDAWGVPLINIKYYKSENIEMRLGLQFNGKSTRRSSSTIATSPVEELSKESNSFNRISIGGAYHFSPKNLLDVYTGAFLPLGWDTYRLEQTMDDDGIVTSKFSPVIGLGAYIGMQAFIADLPISVGIEYGLLGITRGGKQYKTVETVNDKTETYYTEDKTGAGTAYSKLKLSESSFGTDIRITFSYYFNK